MTHRIGRPIHQRDRGILNGSERFERQDIPPRELTCTVLCRKATVKVDHIPNAKALGFDIYFSLSSGKLRNEKM